MDFLRIFQKVSSNSLKYSIKIITVPDEIIISAIDF